MAPGTVRKGPSVPTAFRPAVLVPHPFIAPQVGLDVGSSFVTDQYSGKARWHALQSAAPAQVAQSGYGTKTGIVPWLWSAAVCAVDRLPAVKQSVVSVASGDHVEKLQTTGDAP